MIIFYCNLEAQLSLNILNKLIKYFFLFLTLDLVINTPLMNYLMILVSSHHHTREKKYYFSLE
jgi:hypothetical protein